MHAHTAGRRLVGASILVACTTLATSTHSGGEPEDLRAGHRWLELREALRSRRGTDLQRAALANAFNRPEAERLLRAVIRSGRGGEADEAFGFLSELYLRSGRYRQLTAAVNDWHRRFPQSPAARGRAAETAAFEGLQDQKVVRRAPAVLRHDRRVFLPVSIDGAQARYFFDTGAWLSCLSESEARRIGLPIRSTAGRLANSAGATAGFRTAVAHRLVLGGLELREVTFAVFPDDQEPWSLLRPGERGILGIPVLVAAGAIRWTNDGALELGRAAVIADGADPNLFFDNDHLVVESSVAGERVLATLDTGAETTDLYGRFARQFASLLADRGERSQTEVRGVGHAGNFESVTLPELTFRLGGRDVSLRPARVILQDMGAPCCVANVGFDLLEQAAAFRLDFGSMTLALEGPR